MLSLAFSIAALLLVIAGLCFIVGAVRTGKSLLIGTVLGWALLAVVASLPAQCHSLWFYILGAVLLLAILASLTRHHLLAKALWWCGKHTVIASYHAGLWLTEHLLLCFPVALLPTLPRGLVKLACVFLAPSLVVLAALLASRGNTSASVYFLIAAPLLGILLVGHLGKWLYRREEQRGLSRL